MHCNLKFCYFLILFLIISCNGDVNKKENSQSSVVIETEDTSQTTNSSKTILFFGDSLTAGYGLEDVNDAFPALIQATIDSLKLNYTVINSGISGETTSGGKSRIDWTLNQNVDVFVLELGANDGLRGVPLKETRENLQFIIDAVLKKNPKTKIVIAGMQIPPNMGQAYTTEFRSIFPAIAEKNGLSLIPFLLENVGGIPTLNQADGIHPTIEGHKILAKNVWEVLAEVLEK